MKNPSVLDRDTVFYQFDSVIGFWGIPNMERLVHYEGKHTAHYHVRHNNFGIRDFDYDIQEIQDSIVCLGGSNTWGSAVEQKDRFTDRLNKLVDRDVINMGHNSFGLGQVALTLLTKARRFSPKTIIVEQYPWAVHRVLNTFVNGYIKPFFYLDERENLKLKKVPFLARLKPYRDIVGSYRTYLKELREFSAGIDLQQDYNPQTDPIFFAWKSHYYKYMYKLIGKILLVIRDHCTTNNIQLLFVVLPIRQQFGKKSSSELIDYNLPGIQFIKLLKLHNIHYITLPQLFTHHRKFPVIQFDGHLNRLGHKIAAEQIHLELKRQKWI